MTQLPMIHVLQGQYGQRWEDLTASVDIAEVKKDRQAYEENEGGRYRIIRRRQREGE